MNERTNEVQTTFDPVILIKGDDAAVFENRIDQRSDGTSSRDSSWIFTAIIEIEKLDAKAFTLIS